jgi:hypothetical protein
MVTVEEAAERIEQDDGDPTDEVFKWRDPRGHIYHDDPDCFYIDGQDPVTMTRGEAHDRMLGGCRVCVLDDVDPDHSNEQPHELIEAARQSIEARLD